MAKNWSTPRASLSENRTTRHPPSTLAGKHGRTLAGDAANWPTPNTRDSADSARHTTTTGVMHPGTTLTDAIRQWPTPQARDWKDGRASEATANKNSRPLNEAALDFSLPDETTVKDGDAGSTSTRGPSQRSVLNPRFVEALMTLPDGWTSMRPLAPTVYARWGIRSLSYVRALLFFASPNERGCSEKCDE
jgi:hypothetical protein